MIFFKPMVGSIPLKLIYRAAAFILIAIFGNGCAHLHNSRSPSGIAGKWRHAVGSSGNAAMIYEFRPDGTMSQYSQVDMRSQMPQAGIMTSTKFNGVYTLKQNVLTYHPTSIGETGHSSPLPDLSALTEKYKAEIDGDTLTLSRLSAPRNGPAEEYQRQ